MESFRIGFSRRAILFDRILLFPIDQFYLRLLWFLSSVSIDSSEAKKKKKLLEKKIFSHIFHDIFALTSSYYRAKNPYTVRRWEDNKSTRRNSKINSMRHNP